MEYPAGSKVVAVDQLLNLIAGSQDASYTELVEKLPLFLPLKSFLEKEGNIPLLVQGGKVRVMRER